MTAEARALFVSDRPPLGVQTGWYAALEAGQQSIARSAAVRALLADGLLGGTGEGEELWLASHLAAATHLSATVEPTLLATRELAAGSETWTVRTAGDHFLVDHLTWPGVHEFTLVRTLRASLELTASFLGFTEEVVPAPAEIRLAPDGSVGPGAAGDTSPVTVVGTILLLTDAIPVRASVVGPVGGLLGEPNDADVRCVPADRASVVAWLDKELDRA